MAHLLLYITESTPNPIPTPTPTPTEEILSFAIYVIVGCGFKFLSCFMGYCYCHKNIMKKENSSDSKPNDVPEYGKFEIVGFILIFPEQHRFYQILEVSIFSEN